MSFFFQIRSSPQLDWKVSLELRYYQAEKSVFCKPYEPLFKAFTGIVLSRTAWTKFVGFVSCCLIVIVVFSETGAVILF